MATTPDNSHFAIPSIGRFIFIDRCHDSQFLHCCHLINIDTFRFYFSSINRYRFLHCFCHFPILRFEGRVATLAEMPFRADLTTPRHGAPARFHYYHYTGADGQ